MLWYPFFFITLSQPSWITMVIWRHGKVSCRIDGLIIYKMIHQSLEYFEYNNIIISRLELQKWWIYYYFLWNHFLFPRAFFLKKKDLANTYLAIASFSLDASDKITPWITSNCLTVCRGKLIVYFILNRQPTTIRSSVCRYLEFFSKTVLNSIHILHQWISSFEYLVFVFPW